MYRCPYCGGSDIIVFSVIPHYEFIQELSPMHFVPKKDIIVRCEDCYRMFEFKKAKEE